MQERAQSDKDRTEQVGKTQIGETPHDLMDEDDVGDAGEKSAKRNPTKLLKKNVRKLRKRPGAIKWVWKFGQLLENQNDGEGETPQWARGVWEILLSMDKSCKQYLKDEATAVREKQKRGEKRARKKAKRQARKAAGKKSRDSSESWSNDSTMSSSDESSDSSDGSSESTPRRRTGGRGVGAVSSGALEFKIINGKRRFKSQAGKWLGCSAPPNKPCEQCGQRHWWHERKEFNCSWITGEQGVPGEQGEEHAERVVQEDGGGERRGHMHVSRVQGAEESVQQIRDALLDAVDAA